MGVVEDRNIFVVIVKKILAYLKYPAGILLLLHAHLRLDVTNIIGEKLYLCIFYRRSTGKKLNIDDPKTFNEKIQWLKLHDRNSRYTKLVDKYDVRDFVSNVVGDEYLIPLLGVWDRLSDIDFSGLPDEFVLKSTHDSGGIVLCRDKSTLDWDAAQRKIQRRLKRNYYHNNREWPYKDVTPRIICEQLMKDNDQSDLMDYKIFCFNGVAKLIEVDLDRFTNHKRNIYDTEWNFLPVSIKYQRDTDARIEKPAKLDEMLAVAEKLSKGIPHVRVDLYLINDRIYFGEMTFYHGSGVETFSPEAFGLEMGEWIDLSEIGVRDTVI